MNDMTDAANALKSLLDAQRQATRLMRLSFPKKDGPADVLMVANRLDAYEGLSKDFQFTVEVLSDKPDIELKDVMGKMVTIEVARDDGSMRHFNGYVFDFRFVKNDAGFSYYDLVLLPWLAFLRFRRDNYLFHGKTVEQQSELVLVDCETRDWKVQNLGADEPMTDACQFDETDYNYLHRRWEAKGWHYWYEHRADGHTLVLSGDSTACEPIDGISSDITWQSDSGIQKVGLSSFSPVRTVASTLYAAASFDFKNPRPVVVDTPTVNKQGDVPALEVYEYAGAYGFNGKRAGDDFVRLRMEEIEAAAKRFEAVGDEARVQPGRAFRLAGHLDLLMRGPDKDDNDYLILEAKHTVTNNFEAHRGGSAEYRNSLICLRKKIPWRPGRGFNSSEPRIYGLQTAIVVGPKGEELHTDKYGRVKVQFHWDRVGQYDDQSSAWIRVGSAWTGKGYGFIGIPRVGQEVVVQFLDGNPDRPLVTSCLFNEDNLPAWGFPEAAHQTGIQTRSTPGGNGHCEMVIHDKAGHELLNFRSQKDMKTEVLHDQSNTIHNNQATVVNGPQQTIAVTTGIQATTVKKAIQITSETEGIQHVAHTSFEVSAQTQHIVLEAATDLVLKVGKSTLHMSQDGSILLEGVVITVKGSGKVDVNP